MHALLHERVLHLLLATSILACAAGRQSRSKVQRGIGSFLDPQRGADAAVHARAGRSRDLYTVVSGTGSTGRGPQAEVTDEGAGVVIDSFQGARPF